MRRKELSRLTPLEAVIMDGVWTLSDNGGPPVTVREVQKHLEPVKSMAYNTVLTMMRILREKGFLDSKRQGRVDVYRPLVSREQMGKRSLGEVLDRFFAGSAGALVSQLVESQDLSADEIRAVRRELNEKLRDLGDDAGGEGAGRGGESR